MTTEVMTRLDKVLADADIGTRSECSKYIRRGLVTVDTLIVRKPDQKVSDGSVIAFDGTVITRKRRTVCMMNKPSGLVTSTQDDVSDTVMSILPQVFLSQDVVPAGRLDKDTEGLLIFTNDGDLLHRLISPKSDVRKKYLVRHEGTLTQSCIDMAREGIVLKDKSVCKSALVSRISDNESTIEITQGMYHQVKRMYAAMGLHVTYLRRIAIGGLELSDLGIGCTRELTEEEERLLFEGDGNGEN